MDSMLLVQRGSKPSIINNSIDMKTITKFAILGVSLVVVLFLAYAGIINATTATSSATATAGTVTASTGTPTGTATSTGTSTSTGGGASSSASASASATANAGTNPTPTPTPTNLAVSCYASPSSINQNQSTTFLANVSGGTGFYNYSWSGVCSGSGLTCSRSFPSAGVQTATVAVTSGNQIASANCSVSVGQIGGCTTNYQQRCSGNNLYWYDSCGNQQGLIQYCQNGCYNNACQINNTYSALNVTKTVRNLTSGSGWSNSTYANPSDTVMFMITLQANGNQNVQNVFVRDILPANLIYNNQLVVACTGGTSNYNNCNGNNYNYTGSITSGISINTIYAGQTVTITYQTQLAPAVNFTYGATTLNNNVYVTSSNASSPSANASVIVSRSGVLGASSVATGLTNNFWVDSFFLPLMLVLLGIWLWRNGMLFGAGNWLKTKIKGSPAV